MDASYVIYILKKPDLCMAHLTATAMREPLAAPPSSQGPAGSRITGPMEPTNVETL